LKTALTEWVLSGDPDEFVDTDSLARTWTELLSAVEAKKNAGRMRDTNYPGLVRANEHHRALKRQILTHLRGSLLPVTREFTRRHDPPACIPLMRCVALRPRNRDVRHVESASCR